MSFFSRFFTPKKEEPKKVKILTQDKLARALPNNKHIGDWYEVLDKILPQYEITTVNRIASFLAQCSHESMEFTRLRENLNYRAESLVKTWPRHFPNMEIANQYARQPEKIANRAYANRMGNGNEASGDGWKYAGKGIIQLTGKSNYSEFAKAIKMRLEDVPDYLQTYEGAIKSACWFWKKNNLNSFADVEDIKGQTKVINGGYNGLDDRLKKYSSIKSILE